MMRMWRQTLLTVPSIGVALLPKLGCPLCWPLYAGILSSVGLGFLISAKYLFPVTAAFLLLALWVLAFRAKQRRGMGPFLLGSLASATVLTGKFYFDSNPMMYGGVGLLVIASVWNGWPRSADNAVCSS
jgi:mercuric ion transport protein